jgi:hypothetical protein
MKFRGVVQLNGKTATGIEVPAEVVAALGPSKRPPVRATINGYTYRSSVASMGGSFRPDNDASTKRSASCDRGSGDASRPRPSVG